jgi:cytochrome c-type biogenesis protein CcmF
MIDRTIEKPGQVSADGTGASTFAFGDYTFGYEKLIHTSDDHKDEITAQVGIFRDGERIATVYPAKWDYHKQEQQLTTEVAITVRLTEDVYVVLTGFDLDQGVANFRVYLNPLILWVWLGFIILAIGTLICLIPQSLVDMVTWKPKSPIGRAVDVGIVAGIVVALVLGVASQAHAGPPAAVSEHAPAVSEHVPAGMGMGGESAGWAAKNRPENDTQAHAMNEILCPCGCAHQTIYDCPCQTASDLRRKVMELMAGADMSTEDGRQRAYDAALAQFVKEYGGDVLSTPKSKVSWLLPSLAVVGGLGVLIGLGRKWMVVKHRDQLPPGGKLGQPGEDEHYADKLDDELSHTD